MQKSEKKRVCMKPVCERMAQVTPIIFHIDVNSAYLSWTAVEQLKNGAKVDIREIPAIIGGDQTSRHGVVLAKSTFAKKYGIHERDRAGQRRRVLYGFYEDRRAVQFSDRRSA